MADEKQPTIPKSVVKPPRLDIGGAYLVPIDDEDEIDEALDACRHRSADMSTYHR